MPLTVDAERMKGKPFLRDGVEVKPIMQMDQAAPPTIPIPHYEFPRVVYLHPNQPTQTIEHMNDKFEVVGEEIVPTEHLTKIIACDEHKNGGPKECKACQKLLQKAFDEGYVLEPYVNKTIASGDRRVRNQNLYSRKPQAQS